MSLFRDRELLVSYLKIVSKTVRKLMKMNSTLRYDNYESLNDIIPYNQGMYIDKIIGFIIYK